MKGLTLIQKYDAVLRALYIISGKRPTIGRLQAFVRCDNKKIDWGEVWDILNKMRRDGIIREQIFQTNIKGIDKEIYLITFEGKLMYERKGLKGKMWRESFDKRWAFANGGLTLLIAAISVYYISKGVSEDTANKCYELFQQEQIERQQFLLLEKSKQKILQNIADSVSKKK